MRVLILDAYNLMHRARFGFGKGEYNVVYNFFRGLRPIVDKFTPDRVYFVLEGVPKGNQELLGEYKANRKRSPDSFIAQRAIIESLVAELMPIISIRHDDHEADDVIYTLAKHFSPGHDVVIVSSDSDFIQIYDELDNVTLWHPIKKKVVAAPDYDYLLWKSLRGDKTDNIPGIKGVGNITAEKLVRDPDLLAARMDDPEFASQQEMNYSLIKLEDLGDRFEECWQSGHEAHWTTLRERFQDFEFKSMTKDKTWEKYVNTFTSIEQ